VGVLGSFTTYSTFAVELDTRLGQTHLATALGYGLLSVMLGVAAAAVGLWLGRTAVRDE
jgi:CrcB protein